MAPAGTPLFIVNPCAGSGRAARLAVSIRDWAAAHGVAASVIETTQRGHAQRLAAGAAASGHDRVIAVGGDGTVQEVLNGLLGGLPNATAALPTLGIVPAGRGNDLARTLGLPSDLLVCLPIALGAGSAPLDVGRAHLHDGRERCFAAAGGAGFDAQVAHTMQTRRRFWMRGEAGYTLATLAELRRFRNCELRLTLEGEQGEQVIEGRFLFVTFANGAYFGGGMHICPDARTDDGWLDLCLVGDLSRLAALRELPGIYHARHVGHPKVRLLRARRLRIEGDAGTRVHLDGESLDALPLAGTLPLQVSLDPGAVRVAAPHAAAA